MLILITVLMLNVWAIPADDLFLPNINILEELGKIKMMETRMESMEKDMERLKTENAAQAKELETMRGATNDVKNRVDDLIKQNEVSKVAFSVSLSSSNGPHSSLHTLIYKHIFLNTGDAYDANTGIFTAPMKGVYAFRVFSKAHGSSDKAVVAGLFRNGQHEISTYARQDGGFIGSSNGVSLLLEKGDKVCVNLYSGYWIFDNEHHHSTFSGHLLFPM
ncbi:complement C1q-like protein 4 [Carassius gibelio]|uniref:complement C1q-like protein 4 n=1 Tax=Carassius gibelio TaxID=101364 RepID=UPI0022790818|nr:complement C1q-like protein 4 [Carassius gibelio]